MPGLDHPRPGHAEAISRSRQPRRRRPGPARSTNRKTGTTASRTLTGKVLGGGPNTSTQLPGPPPPKRCRHDRTLAGVAARRHGDHRSRASGRPPVSVPADHHRSGATPLP